MATHRELVYDLTADDAHQVGKIAREHGLETQTWMVTAADGYRLGLRLQVPLHDTSSELTIQEEMARRGRPRPVSTPRRSS